MHNPTEYLRYTFSDTEIADAARDLATANRKRTSLEQRKKEVDSAIKAEIEAENSVIARLSNLIGTGFEYRDIEVRIELDTPEPGKKTIIRMDTGEEVAVKPMTDSEKQMSLDLQTQAEAAEAEAKQPIVTPPPVLTALPEPEVMMSSDVAQEMISKAIDLHGGLASAVSMGGTHQKKRGKQAAAGDVE